MVWKIRNEHMNTCEHDGTVVVYENNGRCPVCERDETIGELELKIKSLEQDIEGLEDSLSAKDDYKEA
jgi:uncharacterized Zn finger protein (UPF0148 family)